MGLFRFFTQQKTDIAPKRGYPFDDYDRAISRELQDRKKELQMMKLQREDTLHKLRIEKEILELQQDLDDMKDQGEEEPSTNTDADLYKMMLPLLMGKMTPAPVSKVSSPLPEKQVLSSQQITEIWHNLPSSVQKMAKKLDDATLSSLIASNMPNLAEQSIAECVQFVKNS